MDSLESAEVLTKQFISDSDSDVELDIPETKKIYKSKRRSAEVTDRDWFWRAMMKILVVMWVLFATCFLPWSVWVTTNIFTNRANDTAIQEVIKHMDVVTVKLEKLDTKVSALPPEDWRKRIERLEEHDDEVDKERALNDRENREDHSDIKVALEGIKGQLGIVAQKVGAKVTSVPPVGGS